MFSAVGVGSDGSVRIAIQNAGCTVQVVPDLVLAAYANPGDAGAIAIVSLWNITSSLSPGDVVVLCDNSPTVASSQACDVQLGPTVSWSQSTTAAFELATANTTLDGVQPWNAAVSALVQSPAAGFVLERTPCSGWSTSGVGCAQYVDPIGASTSNIQHWSSKTQSGDIACRTPTLTTSPCRQPVATALPQC